MVVGRRRWVEAWLGFGLWMLWIGCASDPKEIEAQFRPYYELCSQAIQNGHWNDAAETCQRALDVNPESLDALNAIGLIQANRGNFDKAEIYYNKALELSPNHAPTHTNFGSLLSNQKRYPEAIEHFKVALTEPNSNTFVLHLNYGRACYEMQDWTCAEDHYEKAVREAPNACIANLRLGEVYEKRQRYDEAIQRYRICVKQCGDLSACHFRLGEALAQTSQAAEALQEFEHICKQLPESEEATDACRYLKLKPSRGK